MKKTRRQPVEIARRIVVDPDVRFGQPVIKGTRVPVALLLDELAGGSDVAVIAKEYGVRQDDIRAAIRFAAQHPVLPLPRSSSRLFAWRCAHGA